MNGCSGSRSRVPSLESPGPSSRGDTGEPARPHLPPSRAFSNPIPHAPWPQTGERARPRLSLSRASSNRIPRAPEPQRGERAPRHLSLQQPLSTEPRSPTLPRGNRAPTALPRAPTPRDRAGSLPEARRSARPRLHLAPALRSIGDPHETGRAKNRSRRCAAQHKGRRPAGEARRKGPSAARSPSRHRARRGTGGAAGGRP